MYDQSRNHIGPLILYLKAYNEHNQKSGAQSQISAALRKCIQIYKEKFFFGAVCVCCIFQIGMYICFLKGDAKHDILLQHQYIVFNSYNFKSSITFTIKEFRLEFYVTTRQFCQNKYFKILLHCYYYYICTTLN